MKMKIRCGLLAILLLGSVLMANAGNGIKRSEWDFRPEITTGNVVYFLAGFAGSMILEQKLLGKSLSDEYNPEDKPWWFPQVGWRTTFISEVQYADYHTYDLDVKENFFDWTDPGYSIGYTVNFTSKQVPFGFRVKLSFEHENFKARDKKIKGDWTTFSKNMIVPEGALKIQFGKYRTSDGIFILSLGARYDYAINAKGLYNDKGTVNSGVSGIIGFEIGRPTSHFQAGGNYVIPFYDYFNKNYSPDGGITYPYANAKTSLKSTAEIYFRLGF